MIVLLRFVGTLIVLVSLVSSAIAAGSAFINPGTLNNWLAGLLALVPGLSSVAFGLLVVAAGSALEIAENIERKLTR